MISRPKTKLAWLTISLVSLFLISSCISTPQASPVTVPETRSIPIEHIVETENGQAELLTVNKNSMFELVFTASESPVNPFDTYLLKLQVTDPSGKQFIIDGFYDGDGNGGQTGNVWKARLFPYMTGTWSWSTVPGDQPDSGLAGLFGQFEVTATGDSGSLIRDGRYFRFQNGDYIYLVGNFLDFTDDLPSTHVFMSEEVTDTERDAVIARQREFHDVNKVNIYFANKGDYGGLSVTPWLGTAASNDKTAMDLARWIEYDDHIRRLKDNRMLAELWFLADDSNFGELSIADRNRLLRYAMARTSAFSHVLYVIALEWQEGFQASDITDAGQYIQAHNPWERLLSVHSLTLTDWSYSGESWATFLASQSGNDSDPNIVNGYAQTFHSEENIPHIGEEFGILEYDSDTRLRGNLWANFCGGAAGSGTGSDLKAFQRFLAQSRVPFQRMAPANELIDDGGTTRFVLAEIGHHYVVYSSGGSFSLNVTGSGLQGQWFDPRDPSATLGAPFNVSPGNQIFTPPNNIGKDWVLWISDGSNLNSGTTHLEVLMFVLIPVIYRQD